LVLCNVFLKSNCSICILTKVALLCKKTKDQLPVKSKNWKLGNRYFNYLVLKTNWNTIVQKRTDKRIGTYNYTVLERNWFM
jgi:adenine-specific DNA glycosylase